MESRKRLPDSHHCKPASSKTRREDQNHAKDGKSNREDPRMEGMRGRNFINVKLLIPPRAVGSIMGKGGEALNQWQMNDLKVKMSRATSFFPGTSSRVCLLTGCGEKVQEALEAFAIKIWSRNGAIDTERDLYLTLVVPNETAGLIIGTKGRQIKYISETSGAQVVLSRKEDDYIVQERQVTVSGNKASVLRAVDLILQQIHDDPFSGSCLTVDYDVNKSRSRDERSMKMAPSNHPAVADLSSLDRSDKNSPFTVSLSSGESMHLKLKMDGSNSHIDPNLSEQYLHAIGNSLRHSGFYSPTAIDDTLRSFSSLISHGIFQFEFTCNQGPSQSAFVEPPTSGAIPMDIPPPPMVTITTTANPNSDTTFVSYQNPAWPANAAHEAMGNANEPETREEETIEIEDSAIGSIMGRGGHILVEIQKTSQTTIVISSIGVFAPNTMNRIVTITGTKKAIQYAKMLIQERISRNENSRRQNAK
ncbi:RNA-binding protein Nova-1-like [Tigriopus californicus]|nr:RNA-binding protein Nova-1-like [Tigriopus californicus]